MANDLPATTFPQLQAMAADPKATAAFYKPWSQCVNGPEAGKSCAKMEPMAAEGQ